VVEAAAAGGDGAFGGVSEAIVRLAGVRVCVFVLIVGADALVAAQVLVHRFVQGGGGGGGKAGGPPPPPPCDEKLMRALVMLHVPPSSSSSSSSVAAAASAAAAAAKLLALLPPPVRIDRGECARLLLQLQVTTAAAAEAALLLSPFTI